MPQVPSSSAMEGAGIPPLGQHHGLRAALGWGRVALVFGAQWFQQSVEVVSDSLRPHGLQHARLPCPFLSPRGFAQVHVHSVGDADTGVGCHYLLQRIFLAPGVEPGSPALQVDSLTTEPPRKPMELFRCRKSMRTEVGDTCAALSGKFRRK